MADRVIKTSAEPLKSEEHPLFARAFREHYPDLIAFVRRRVSTDAEAADIAQEAYLRVLRYRDEKNLEDLRALVFRIAINLIGMRVRLARNQHWAEHIPVEEELTLVAKEPSPDRQIAGEEQLKRVVATIEKLPRKCQQAFLLRRFHGLSHQDIATRMGISVKAVEKHITAALTICRKRVGDEWP